jgi:hypothetical protein
MTRHWLTQFSSLSPSSRCESKRSTLPRIQRDRYPKHRQVQVGKADKLCLVNGKLPDTVPSRRAAVTRSRLHRLGQSVRWCVPQLPDLRDPPRKRLEFYLSRILKRGNSGLEDGIGNHPRHGDSDDASLACWSSLLLLPRPLCI